MSEVTLTRQYTVWNRSHEIMITDAEDQRRSVIVFRSDGRTHSLYREGYEDMGSPERITTSAEPGDLLNTEGS
jgi:hypothetical protein